MDIPSEFFLYLLTSAFYNECKRRMKKMAKDIFISYSRRDQEFVTRLASDLSERIPGVWFDQSAIQMGQQWHEEVLDGIRESKAVIVVLSPDALGSQYVREEVNRALELGKFIFPVLFRPGALDGEANALVRNVPILDLSPARYAQNLPKLVDELNEAESAITVEQKPILSSPDGTGMRVVLSKVIGWAFFWSVGWLAFWLIVIAILIVVQVVLRQMDATEARSYVMLLISSGVGGFVGGILAGLLTMLALRSYAANISWDHMEPTIRIWGMVGPLGTLVLGVFTTIMVAAGVISLQTANITCDGLSLSQCLLNGLGNMIGQALAMALTIVGIFVLVVLAIWFITGMFAGRQAVQHIRRLEPGITSWEGRGVSIGWGCGSIVAAGVMMAVFGAILNMMGL
jgi:hypothetical protein